MTVAYTWALQYWAEQANPPVHLDNHPLAMSVIELMWWVRGHIIFYKSDVLQNLEEVAPETEGMDSAASLGHPNIQPTPIKLIPLPTMADVNHMPSGPMDAPSPIRTVAQIILTGPVVKLAGPLILLDCTKEERWYVLIVTASVRELNLETTGVILGETVTASAGGLVSGNPQMAAVFPGLTWMKRAVAHPSATIEEVTVRDLERGSQ